MVPRRGFSGGEGANTEIVVGGRTWRYGRVLKALRSRTRVAALSPIRPDEEEFSGRSENVNNLGGTLATEDGRLAFFPWASVAGIVLATQ